MANNSIPPELQSDHLFLLVGTNPLPAWVAIQLLLREDGQLYLIHSLATDDVARRLAIFPFAQRHRRKPIYISVESPFDASTIARAIEQKLALIRSGSIGLNYTGGTKVMAVHAYRAIERALPRGLPSPVFSYLEAATGTMRFEPTRDYPTGAEPKIGFVKEVELKLGELFSLHEDFSNRESEKDVKAKPVFEMLMEAHTKWDGQRDWRRKCDEWLKYSRSKPTGHPRKKPGNIMTEPELRLVKLKNWHPQFARIADALAPNGSPEETTLGDIVKNKDWGFTSATEMAEWLDGKWLEHYVLQQFIDRAQEFRVHDYGRNIKVRLPRISEDDDFFEADVAAIRGYQLHLISCYSGSTKRECKLKLFEVFTRVRQLGGDETKAALVCCSDDPRAVEADVGQIWDMKDRVKVFGRSDLRKLGNRLCDWFATGAQ